MEQKKKAIDFDYSGAKSVFTDVVQVNILDDVVHLGIGLKERDGKAIVSHKIYMTLNHFFKFSEVCSQATIDIKKNISANIIKEKSKK